MKLLPLLIFLFTFITLPSPIYAVTIAEQTQNFGNQLNVWQAIQELGSLLDGKAGSFTFRVRTTKTNLEMFDYTAQNTKIYDKDTNTKVANGCHTGSASDPLGGLTFTTAGVPVGFEDVTIDFSSCNSYSFTQGHKYLIIISNANMAQFGGSLIYFAAAAYGSSSTDHFNGGGLRYAFDNKFCNPITYQWNSSISNANEDQCNIWTTPKDDLYFILANTSPPPKTPVIFIPGIGGSEFKAGQDIIWADQDDGHGGKFSHAYTSGEKIWVNEGKAAELGEDDYFDVLRLKSDGVTSEASLSLTGDLTSFGYGDIDSFFTGLGYEKGKNFFVFPYDWRKDVRVTKDSLDALIEEAKTKSGQTKVNLVAHSMGGLVARYYIADSGRASKVNKLISMGVPHLGATKALKTLMYGDEIKKDVFGIFALGIPSSEVKDVFQNLPSAFQLLPSKKFYDFYDNSAQKPFPFSDERDIDSNKVTGALNFIQIKGLLENLIHNMTVFDFGEQLHNLADPLLNQSSTVKLYNIAGTSQPTLGQIRETWLIQWPINLISIRDEVFINGDNTVPLYSASLKSDSLDFSGSATIYYVEQKHSDLVSKDGTAMQTVKSILEESDLPVEVKSEKIDLEGQHVSLDDGELELYDDEGKHTGIKDDGEIETNIPETFYSTSGKTKHAFVKKKAKKVKVRATRKKKTSSDPKTTNLKIRSYKQDKVSKTTIYRDVLIAETAKVEFDLDPAIDTSPTLALFPDSTKSDSTNINLTSEVSGGPALDQTSPSTKIELSGSKDSLGKFISSATVTLSSSDSESGILKTEYSLDNGKTVQTYSNPFTVSTPGKTTLQVKSIDKLGNEEIPQEKVIEIASSTSSSSSSSSSGNNSSSTAQSTSEESVPVTSEVLRSDSSEVDSTSSSQDILGLSTQNPVSSAQLKPLTNNQPNLLTSSMLILTMFMAQSGIILLSSLRSVLSFLKPTPK